MTIADHLLQGGELVTQDVRIRVEDETGTPFMTFVATCTVCGWTQRRRFDVRQPMDLDAVASMDATQMADHLCVKKERTLDGNSRPNS
jgi:RNase P subunit RPR2